MRVIVNKLIMPMTNPISLVMFVTKTHDIHISRVCALLDKLALM